LVFFAQILDRMAYERMGPEGRAEFITALVRRLAEVLQENEDGLLGPPPAGTQSYFDEFIDLFNELADHYAEFSFQDGAPDFAFVRYLGHRIEALMSQKDQRWVVEQMMAAEVPEAIAMLRRGMQGVLSTEPRAPRSRNASALAD
jgi:hypothetical protein